MFNLTQPDSDNPSVNIQKAENGYMVTLQPKSEQMSFLQQLGIPGIPPDVAMGSVSHPAQSVDELKKAHERSRSRVYVFADLNSAWEAIQSFLLDARMPK